MKYEPSPLPTFPAARSLNPPRHIAILGNFPPRRCGLATYTHDSYVALKSLPDAPRLDVYVMDDGLVSGYPDDVAMLIPEADCSAYVEAADRINASGAEIAWIQHEFGIFGGDDGNFILALINRLTVPVAVTFHTVLERPSEAQKRIMAQLLARATVSIVMAEKGVEIIHSSYPAGIGRTVMIPHGVPDRPYEPTSRAKARLRLQDRPTVLTFGLLSPDKGIADMIEAMPAISMRCPNVHYVVLGATHPHLKRRHGDNFRTGLIERVEELGLTNSVTFVDRFVELDELLDWLAAADVYVTPYLNPSQITSGTLSYAVALGKPVVSTPYVHATEILADEHGVLVPFRSPDALAGAISDLLLDDRKRLDLAERAYERGRNMTWQRNAEAVVKAMTRGLRSPQGAPARLARPILSLGPVERLTDGTGMLQHSIFGVADRDHGYCIDDNARALMLMAIAEDLPLERRLAFAATYASFIQSGWNADTQAYRNFMSFDRTWLETVGSEDSNGRTLWALGVTARMAPSAAFRRWAAQLFDITIEPLTRLGALRATAFAMLGSIEMLEVVPDHRKARTLVVEGASSLQQLLFSSRRPDWAWFEIMLSYDNARLPEALIRAGITLERPDMVESGIEALDWITSKTRGANGHFQPVGTDSFGKPFAEPAMFDQQPLEAWAMIDACAAAWTATGEDRWVARATAAHNWFLGANILGQALIDPLTGECHDGLTPFGVNLNHGAESVLSWQLAHRRFLGLLANASNATRMTPAKAA